jgi:uncharacterized membrane protein YgcG
MNTEWQLTKNRTRRIVAWVLLVASFIWLVFFLNFMLTAFRYSTPDPFTVWSGMVIFSLFVFGFAYLISTEKLWKMILVFCYVLTVITGMFMIPIPEGYAEAVLGVYCILSMSPLLLYARYKKSRKAVKRNIQT